MLGDITVSMPEFAAQNRAPQHAIAWVNEEEEEDEEHEAQPTENEVAG